MKLMRKQIDLDASPILYQRPLTPQSFADDFIVYGGEWWWEDGWLTGRNPGNFPGMIYLKEDFPGNVLVEFEARTVLPATHDINFMWNGSWDEERNERGVAYVAGVQGWWNGKVGIEKSPDYKLNVGTPLFAFQPGKCYHLQGGSIEGHCFLFVDGQLLLEVTDPDPIDATRFCKVGFEAYCTWVQYRSITVRRIAWQPVEENYNPEF